MVPLSRHSFAIARIFFLGSILPVGLFGLHRYTAFAPGMYFLVFSSDEGQYYKKVVLTTK